MSVACRVWWFCGVLALCALSLALATSSIVRFDSTALADSGEEGDPEPSESPDFPDDADGDADDCEDCGELMTPSPCAYPLSAGVPAARGAFDRFRDREPLAPVIDRETRPPSAA